MDLLSGKDVALDPGNDRIEQPGRLSALVWHSIGFADGTLASLAQSHRVERSRSSPSRA
jgi:hypothetical protein